MGNATLPRACAVLATGIVTLCASPSSAGQDSTANCRDSVVSKLRDGSGTVCTPPPSPADDKAKKSSGSGTPGAPGPQGLTPSPSYLPDAPFAASATAGGAGEGPQRQEGTPVYLPDAPFVTGGRATKTPPKQEAAGPKR
ncbi:hypothetical protein ACFQ1E_01230 [Sphingomonas canadensis]|uniref:Translation initiation factor IF-2 n=1 Tax=Sphingomonas canadensis TaxID=1219257 RepID=A0ABW3H1C7_9SPHN|nr:hypothetical protein [Sphingomonas canadensis]MCW3835136.1 hypothetical protein [Sphingomonas canadensis]